MTYVPYRRSLYVRIWESAISKPQWRIGYSFPHVGNAVTTVTRLLVLRYGIRFLGQTSDICLLQHVLTGRENHPPSY